MTSTVAASLLLLVAVSDASPVARVQSAVAKAIAVAQAPNLPGDTSTPNRREAIRDVAVDLFDFTEMARLALGRHWGARSTAEREEFVRLFTDLLLQSYVTTVQNHPSNYEIQYLSESVQGEHAVVKSKILTHRRQEVQVQYHLHHKPGRWAVYDVVIDGVGVVSSYRSQINKVLETSAFEDLLRMMRSN